MKQHIALTALLCHDYDEAIDFYTRMLGFRLVCDEHRPEQDKRWVVIAPPGTGDGQLLLARATDEEQRSRIGNQTGGRVFLFLYTDDFWRDYREFRDRGVQFVRDPVTEDYGTVAVFKDLYGNLWDLIEPAGIPG